MPPTFLIFLLLAIWIPSACLVWIVALVILLFAKTRRFSGPLSRAMAWTFPFVLAYQLLAALPVGILLLSGWAFWKRLEPGSSTITTNPIVIVVSVSIAFITLGTMLIATMAGFYDGWKTGWQSGQGRNLRNVISEAPMYRRLSRGISTLASKWNRTKLKSEPLKRPFQE